MYALKNVKKGTLSQIILSGAVKHRQACDGKKRTYLY